MKKFLIISSLALSVSYMSSSYAVEPVTVGAVAGGGAAEVAAGVSAAEAVAIVGAAGAVSAVGTAGAGILGGVGTAVVMNDKLFATDNENCTGKEKACENAKIGTWTGAALGTLGVVSALAIEGVSAAGLASIGSIIGGGAVIGGATLVAAPIIAAAAVGGATYGLFALLGDDDSIQENIKVE